MRLRSENSVPAPETLKMQAGATNDTPAKVDALAELSRLNWQSDPQEAQRLAAEGRAIAERLHYRKGLAACLNSLGAVQNIQGKFDQALPLFLEAAKLYEEDGNLLKAGRSIANMGHVHAAQSRNAEALACYERATVLGLKAQDPGGVATAKDGMGNVLQAQGRYQEAIQAYRESMVWAAKAGDEQSRAITLNNLANCQLEGGDPQGALRGYLAAAEAFEKLKLPVYQALAYTNIAPILMDQGMPDQGRMYLERALEVQRKAGNRPGEGTTLLNLGVMLHDSGKLRESVATYEAARRIFQELTDQKNEALALHNLGRSYTEQGAFDQGIRALREALRLRESVEDERGAISSRLGLGEALTGAGRQAEALPMLNAALKRATELKVPELEVEGHRILALAYKAGGRWREAAEHLTRHVDLMATLVSSRSQTKVAEMQTRFETERKEREILVLQKDKEIQDLRLHRQALLRNTLLGAVLLLGALSLAVASRYRLKKRSEAVLREKNGQLEEANHVIELERDKSEQLLLNVLPPSIAGRLKNDSVTIADRFTEATILFADIVGFTQLSQKLDAESLVGVLNDIFTRFDILTDKHGLEKIKTIGDCYMVVGGIPDMKADHCEAVGRMALDMLAELHRFNMATGHALDIRIGLNTGVVVAGVIGRKKFIYDLWGDAVNTASRMESHGEPSRIHATEAVVEKVGHLFQFEPRGEIEVKGKGPMRTYFLVGELSA
ncbi:MAG TPA: adenylate/guanylate cyclase domain-containing protein [Geothrix sp.]|nr:adenylate/guanylate cyclase domain-containing protein [Geothrix sp.]